MSFTNLIQLAIVFLLLTISVWQTLKAQVFAGRITFIIFDVILLIALVGMLIGFLRNTTQ